MRHTCKKYAVHKAGTEMFGSLCSFKAEAQDLLDDLHKNIKLKTEDEKSRYHIVEVELSWDE